MSRLIDLSKYLSTLVSTNFMQNFNVTSHTDGVTIMRHNRRLFATIAVSIITR